MLDEEKALGCIMGSVIGNVVGEVFSNRHHEEITTKDIEWAMTSDIG